MAWLGLGNCYGNLNRPRRAAECHRRCLELDPACVEASVRLGEYLREQGSRQEAYTVYRDAWRRRHRWVYHRLGRLRAPDIERDVLEALEKLRREVAPKDPPFAAVGPRPSPGKIGRNDPCPCNSGNKFKKCCGR
ncbi:MAG: SEC-C domain-containing protein [Candidatus Wallbacteria bacterium]|nr:SEC-C domain-containing protein [Candidatus Wallbacteria bacterium]